ncbi:HAMP domain-containing sensor histidine kinase [Desulfosporosinus sp. FKA]|uniref:HAMP domain-containing sensor histidine kinase n=1 Tax=Desulfosporosinus sp. FKA TaxID=1969834 RepID=UPI000B49F08B|nr:HAMP domain-containing sensor histidine kinase [Desulfosporosinus sp. FKA]
MLGIRKRLVGSYLLVVLVAVVLLEGFLLLAIRSYYYGGVEQILTKQDESAANFYHSYLSGKGLTGSADSLMRSLAANTSAQVQVISPERVILADSMMMIRQPADSPDVNEALAGKPGRWQGITRQGEAILTVDFPLKDLDGRNGALRMVTTLTGVGQAVSRLTWLLFGLGLLVTGLAAATGLWLASSITGPVLEITRVAGEMGQGMFNSRAPVKSGDELGNLAETLNFLAAEILRQERLKSEFIASVSHDLKTPLTSIKGWALTLLHGDDHNQDELREGLQIISGESDRLALLVDDLLDFSRLESGRATLCLEEVDLAALLQHCVKQLQPRSERQQVSLSLAETEERLPSIKGDSRRLKQVFLNILDNALKFTPSSGRITVEIVGRGTELTVTIRDTGCGIAPEHLNRVTERFYKAESQIRGNGLGLGLAICREILDLHGGRLSLRSTSGKGTEVEVILPVTLS